MSKNKGVNVKSSAIATSPCERGMVLDYLYDAFISYRQLPLDKAVAERLLNLLEAYRLPRSLAGKDKKRACRVYLDKNEFPFSGNLSPRTQDALEKSRFLIVVCSEETQNSQWCMEEINCFKKLHNDSTANILTLLVSGDPQQAFSPELFYERRPVITEEGDTVITRVEVNPLCADVRAFSMARSLRRLDREFLRLAAPLLDCSYETVLKHRRRIKALRAWSFTTAAVAGLAAFTAYSAVMLQDLSARQTTLYTNESLSLSFYAQKAVREEDPLLGILLSSRALPQNSSAPERPFITQAVTALRSAVFQLEHHKAVLPFFKSLSFEFETSNVTIAQRSPDESRIAVTDFTSHYVYDTANGALLWQGKGQVIYNKELTLAAQLEAKRDGAGSTDSYRYYDVLTGELLSEGQKYLSPEFNLKEDEAQGEENIEGAPVKTLSPTETYAVYTMEEKGTVFSVIEKAQSKELVLSLPLETGHYVFNHDDRYVAFIMDGKLFVVDLTNVSIVYSMEGEGGKTLRSFEFTKDGKLLLVSLINPVDTENSTGTITQNITQNSTRNNTWNNTLSGLFTDTVRVVAWLENTTLLEETGYAYAVGDKPWIYINSPGKITRYEYKAEALAYYNSQSLLREDPVFSQNCERALVKTTLYPDTTQGEMDAPEVRIALFETVSGELLVERTVMKSRQKGESVSTSAHVYFYTPDMTRLVCLTTEGNLEYWDVPGKTLLWSHPVGEEYPVSVAVDDTKERIACAYSDRRIVLLNTENGEYREMITQNPYDNIIQLEFQGELLLASGRNQAYVRDLSSGKEWFYDDWGSEAANTDGYLTDKGLLFLTRTAPQTDLAIYKASTGERLFSSQTGVASWAYSQNSGCLVYRTYTGESHAASILSVSRWIGKSFISEDTLVPKDPESQFLFDNSGQYLLLNGTGGTEVYSLSDKSLVMDVRDTRLAMYNNTLYALGIRLNDVWPQPVIRLPFYSNEELEKKSGELLTSQGKRRELTSEELRKYFID